MNQTWPFRILKSQMQIIAASNIDESENKKRKGSVG
jgi:hypothetical protein